MCLSAIKCLVIASYQHVCMCWKLEAPVNHSTVKMKKLNNFTSSGTFILPGNCVTAC